MLLGSFHIRPLLKRHTRCLVTSVHPQNGPLKRGDKGIARCTLFLEGSGPQNLSPVTVAMSGGVDSSVTAALLAQSVRTNYCQPWLPAIEPTIAPFFGPFCHIYAQLGYA